LADELRRIGVNLNQLTRAVNSGYAGVIDLTEITKGVNEIWQSLNSLPRDVR
ncbi:MAG: MobC family plasmid mobilization relaxosome protein, partial [Clostridia bacterium]|nr:MobC family plasmid mobilization relaxosome protein [Clostridia bacterium]